MFKKHFKGHPGGHCKSMKTDFLFAGPSTLFGFARFLDFAGTFDRYNVSRTPGEADARAMYSDWRMVGEDLVDAITTWECRHKARVEAAKSEPAPKQLHLHLP